MDIAEIFVTEWVDVAQYNIAATSNGSPDYYPHGVIPLMSASYRGVEMENFPSDPGYLEYKIATPIVPIAVL